MACSATNTPPFQQILSNWYSGPHLHILPEEYEWIFLDAQSPIPWIQLRGSNTSEENLCWWTRHTDQKTNSPAGIWRRERAHRVPLVLELLLPWDSPSLWRSPYPCKFSCEEEFPKSKFLDSWIVMSPRTILVAGSIALGLAANVWIVPQWVHVKIHIMFFSTFVQRHHIPLIMPATTIPKSLTNFTERLMATYLNQFHHPSIHGKFRIGPEVSRNIDAMLIFFG